MKIICLIIYLNLLVVFNACEMILYLVANSHSTTDNGVSKCPAFHVCPITRVRTFNRIANSHNPSTQMNKERFGTRFELEAAPSIATREGNAATDAPPRIARLVLLNTFTSAVLKLSRAHLQAGHRLRALSETIAAQTKRLHAKDVLAARRAQRTVSMWTPRRRRKLAWSKS